jgi:glycosyltransferase involved in cell wall biosynthesis
MKKNKFFILTTIPISLNFFKRQISLINSFTDVTLISSNDQILEKIAEREGVRYKAINMKRNISLINDFISLVKLCLFFLKEKPKIIHCNTPKASLLGLLAGFISRVPVRIYFVHGLRYDSETGFKKHILIIMEKICCLCATNIIAVSVGIKKGLNVAITAKQIDIIHNGSPNGLFLEEFNIQQYDKNSIRDELKITKGDFVYGFVGRIVSDKGINELVSSFLKINEYHKNTKLILVGPYEEDLYPLESQTLKSIDNQPNILALGFQKDVKKYLSVMNVFVSPSYREGFGLSILEANLMGIPVIASEISGHSDIIVENSNGFFIKRKDIYSLHNQMLYVLNNPDKLNQMSEDCLQMAKSRYNHYDVVSHAMDYYKKII